MTLLAALQREFQQHLLAGDAAITSRVAGSASAPALTRLAIYSDAYRLRLTEALASNFPRSQQWLGAVAFATIAREYITSHPSTFRSIRWFGAALPAVLELSRPEEPWLADLARWEWSLAAAFDARDVEPVGEATLASIAPEQWPALRLEFHPSLQRLRLQTNAPALFKALSEEIPSPPGQLLPCEQGWLIWRQGLKTHFRSLDAAEDAALTCATGEGTFADLCDALCTVCDPAEVPVRAASLLKRWVADGLVVGVRDYEEAVSG